jgi:hypothetical protein
LNEAAAPDPIRLALDVADAALAARLAALLAGVPGLQLVGLGEAADVTVVLPAATSQASAGDHQLTPRELEVLALLAEGASNKVIARRLGISITPPSSTSARCSTSWMRSAAPTPSRTRPGSA